MRPCGPDAAVARLQERASSRSAFLAIVAAGWEQLDPAEFPFKHHVAAELRDHDDREQFLAGIDLILAGAESLR